VSDLRDDNSKALPDQKGPEPVEERNRQEDSTASEAAEASAEQRAELAASNSSSGPADSAVTEAAPQSEGQKPPAAVETDPEREAKLKAAAEARAARAAAKAAEAGADDSAPSQQPAAAGADPEREAKLKAAAEARAARAAAKAAADAAAEAAPPEPKPPSPKQPLLDAIAAVLKKEIAADAVEDAYINELNDDMPTIIIANAHWGRAARLLKEHESLSFNYLRNVSGVDYETHMEVVYHMIDLASKREVAIKVKTDRDAASVESAAPLWSTANWNEREIYDLLGIYFPGHPDLRRIMMPDDWVGHPLRKDYEPLDSEV